MTNDSTNPIALIERLVEGGRCKYDMLNPCFDNRLHDVPGWHPDGTEACAHCTAKAFLSAHQADEDAGMGKEEAQASIEAGIQWYKDRDVMHELPDAITDLLIGDMVSIDISTCDEDADRRVFGKILEHQTPAPDGGDRVWLCDLEQVNYELGGDKLIYSGVAAMWDGDCRATADLDEPKRVGWKTRIPLAPVTHTGPARFWVVLSFGNPDNTPPLFTSVGAARSYANELEENGFLDVKLLPLAPLVSR